MTPGLERSSLRKCLIVALFPLFFSCGVVGTLGDLSRLGAEVGKEYKQGKPSLNLHNGHVLTVSFVNSTFNSLDSDHKKEQARRIANFVKTRLSKYPSLSECDVIGVSFVVNRNYFLIFHSNSFEHFSFRIEELNDTP